MKSENKVRGEFTSSTGEVHIDECDMVIAFGFSEEDDHIKVQIKNLGGDINVQHTMGAFGHSIARIIEHVAVDRIHAILLQELVCAAIRNGIEGSSDENDFIEALFGGESE